MDTVKCIQKAIDFIEDNIFDDLDYEIIASQAYMSNFYFQRVFSIIFNITLGDYIRNRRLTLAGIEIKSSNAKIIDIAFKYGYESPESFSRAFSRFHGVSPMMARNQSANVNALEKISVNLILGGINSMNNLKQRGYTVKENAPVYYTKNMDKTLKWFEDILGWYGGIEARDENGNGIYGCVMPIPEEIINMKIATFNGIHLLYGEPLKQTVTFMRVDVIDEFCGFVKKNGWKQITEIETQQWGGRECNVTTIDDSLMRFFQLD